METADTTHIDTKQTTSVHDAIARGLKATVWPSRIILISCIALCILLLIFASSGWDLLLIPIGMFASVFYENTVSENWQLWAYENVRDIHQLQRSAELAGLLTRGSHERVDRFLSGAKKKRLRTLQERFKEDAVFVDDPSIPGRTPIYPADNSDQPVLALNSAGIWTESEGFFEWGQVSNERIPVVSSSRRLFTGAQGTSRSEYLFRFDQSGGYFEIPMDELRIKVWELDLLLYIYRGRFASNNASTLSLP